MEHRSKFIQEAAEKGILLQLLEKYSDSIIIFDDESSSVKDIDSICMNGRCIQINVENLMQLPQCDCDCEGKE